MADARSPEANARAEAWFIALSPNERMNILADLGPNESVFQYYWRVINPPTTPVSVGVELRPTNTTTDSPPIVNPAPAPPATPAPTFTQPGYDQSTGRLTVTQPREPSGYNAIGGFNTMPVPALIVPTAAAIGLMARGAMLRQFAGGGGGVFAMLRQTAVVGGILGLADDLLEQVGIDLWPDDPRGTERFRDIANDLDALVAQGVIMTAGMRRDGTQSPANYLTINLNEWPNPKSGWTHPEYINRNFVNAVRKNALTPRTQVRSVPARRGRGR